MIKFIKNYLNVKILQPVKQWINDEVTVPFTKLFRLMSKHLIITFILNTLMWSFWIMINPSIIMPLEKAPLILNNPNFKIIDNSRATRIIINDNHDKYYDINCFDIKINPGNEYFCDKYKYKFQFIHIVRLEGTIFLKAPFNSSKQAKTIVVKNMDFTYLNQNTKKISTVHYKAFSSDLKKAINFIVIPLYLVRIALVFSYLILIILYLRNKLQHNN